MNRRSDKRSATSDVPAGVLASRPVDGKPGSENSMCTPDCPGGVVEEATAVADDDAGAVDAGAVDAGAVDAGAVDVGAPDVGAVDTFADEVPGAIGGNTGEVAASRLVATAATVESATPEPAGRLTVDSQGGTLD